jgi:hypothetical protein
MTSTINNDDNYIVFAGIKVKLRELQNHMFGNDEKPIYAVDYVPEDRDALYFIPCKVTSKWKAPDISEHLTLAEANKTPCIVDISICARIRKNDFVSKEKVGLIWSEYRDELFANITLGEIEGMVQFKYDRIRNLLLFIMLETYTGLEKIE